MWFLTCRLGLGEGTLWHIIFDRFNIHLVFYTRLRHIFYIINVLNKCITILNYKIKHDKGWDILASKVHILLKILVLRLHCMILNWKEILILIFSWNDL